MLILDTHVFLWWMAGGQRLLPDSRDAISRPDNACFVSAVVAWEIAIKVALGKMPAPPESVAEGARLSGFRELDISFRHAEEAGALPLHHADPFDRMLVAQARTEDLTLVTADRNLAAYDVPILWA